VKVKGNVTHSGETAHPEENKPHWFLRNRIEIIIPSEVIIPSQCAKH